MSVVGTEPRGLPHKINMYIVAIELYRKAWWYKPSLHTPATQEPETGDTQVRVSSRPAWVAWSAHVSK